VLRVVLRVVVQGGAKVVLRWCGRTPSTTTEHGGRALDTASEGAGCSTASSLTASSLTCASRHSLQPFAPART